MPAQRNTGDDTTSGPATGAAGAGAASARPSASEPPAESGTKAKERGAERAGTPDAPIHGLGPRASRSSAPVTVSGTTVDGSTARLASALARAKSEAEAEAKGKATGASATRAGESGGAMPVAVASARGDGSPPEGEDPSAGSHGRPRKPMLAAAAMAGAVLISLPLLLMAGGNDKDDKRNTGRNVAAGADTALGADGQQVAPGDYATDKPAKSPSPKPSKTHPEKQKEGVRPSKAPSSKPASKKTTAPLKPVRSEPKSQKSVPKWTTKTVSATSELSAGQSWWTNRIRMTMQGDGNLVVYNEDNKPIWAAGVFGENHKARFQKDGNLVVYTADNRAVWASRTNGHDGAKLTLRADGKVVIMDGNNKVWST